jgi:glycine cleavage system aminomethyltransferase T
VSFVSVDALGAIARSPMERCARAAQARFERRDGWNVAVSYPVAPAPTGWADVSHLGKLEVHEHSLGLGTATRSDGAWWCPLTERRALVLCQPARLGELKARLGGSGFVDVTSVFAAITLVGPRAREVFARFCALDLRDAVTPVGSFRPGSIARQPGMLLREAEQRYLFLFGWAIGEYMWTVVEDAARHLGARPIGVDALVPLEARAREEPRSDA